MKFYETEICVTCIKVYWARRFHTTEAVLSGRGGCAHNAPSVPSWPLPGPAGQAWPSRVILVLRVEAGSAQWFFTGEREKDAVKKDSPCRM